MSLGNYPSGHDNATAVPTEPIWRLTVRQYHEMVRAGILTEDDPVELLQGWLVAKMPKKPPHSLSTQLTADALAKAIPEGWHVNAQEPITTEDSEPEPDVAVVRGCRRDYSNHHPEPSDVGLLVEVSDTTLDRDRGPKKRLYAAAGISNYWIIDIANRCVEAYADPSGSTEQPDYGSCVVYHETDAIAVVVDSKQVGQIPVRDLLA